jgi:hypothetical protein
VASLQRSTAFLIALALAVPAGQAAAQSPQPAVQAGACFEVVPAQARPYPTGPILLNRCSGQTWLLVRSYHDGQDGGVGSLAYRWRPIATDDREAVLAPARSERPAPRIPKAGRGKCFVFDGRTFCE